MPGKQEKEYQTLSDFYPFYLSQHTKMGTKLLHFIGTSFGLSLMIVAFLSQSYGLILAGVAVGYLFAWVSHMFVEKNRPATFTYPVMSFVSDFRLFWELLAGKRSFKTDSLDVTEYKKSA